MTWNCQLEKRISGKRQRIPALALRGRLLFAGPQKEPDLQFSSLLGPLFNPPCAQTELPKSGLSWLIWKVPCCLPLHQVSFCICLQRSWHNFKKCSQCSQHRPLTFIQKYFDTYSWSHYLCVRTFVIWASFVLLIHPISCLHVVNLCFILLIENSLWLNAWRNEAWMMCAFALVNLFQSLA